MVNKYTKTLVALAAVACFSSTTWANPIAEPANATERAQLIDKLIVQKDWANALNQIQIGLAENPKSAQLRFKQAVVHEKAGKLARAKALYEDMIRDYPEVVDPYNNLASIYASQGNTAKALDLLQRAVTVNPGYALGHENLGDLYLQKAISHYENAVRAKPQNARMIRKLKSAQSLVP